MEALEDAKNIVAPILCGLQEIQLKCSKKKQQTNKKQKTKNVGGG